MSSGHEGGALPHVNLVTRRRVSKMGMLMVLTALVILLVLTTYTYSHYYNATPLFLAI
jgi:hypothetical protein